MMNEKREKITVAYKRAYNDFANVSGMTQLAFASEPEMNKISQNLTPKNQYVNLLVAEGQPDKAANEQPVMTYLADYVVDPKYADTAPVSQLYESTEYMKNVYGQLLNIDTKSTVEVIKRTNSELTTLSEEVADVITPDDATNHISDYFRSMLDLDFCSKNFNTIVDACSELDKVDLAQSGETKAPVVPIETRKGILQNAWNTLKEREKQITVRYKTFIKDTGSFLVKSLDQFGELINKGMKELREKIGQLLIDLADKFLDFAGKLIERMFSFLTHVGNLTSKEGFNLSEIEVKLPKIEIKQVTIFSFISIPVPTIDPPDITLKISGKK